MGRVPITIMGFHCERCGHEWIPRGEYGGIPSMPEMQERAMGLAAQDNDDDVV